MSTAKIARVLTSAKKLAKEFRELTGKPLGITAEIGEFEAAQKLKLKLAEARTPGYDATDRKGCRYQIKTRVIPSDRRLSGQRMGVVKLDHPWDALLLVLLDENFAPRGIFKVSRQQVWQLLNKTHSKSRKRGALGVSEVISIGVKLV